MLKIIFFIFFNGTNLLLFCFFPLCPSQPIKNSQKLYFVRASLFYVLQDNPQFFIPFKLLNVSESGRFCSAWICPPCLSTLSSSGRSTTGTRTRPRCCRSPILNAMILMTEGKKKFRWKLIIILQWILLIVIAVNVNTW